MIILAINCRFCNESLTNIFVDLGISPLSNAFLKKEMLDDLEKKHPLCAYVCDNCFLVQLPEFEKPESIFEDYAYFSSYSSTWLQHAKDYVEMIIPRLSLNENSIVIEIASNDGYLLQNFIEKNITVLGIEPAQNIAKAAMEKNIPTLTKFFNSQLAKDLVKEGKKADLIIGNNVLAHVPCLNDFIIGLKILLKPNGVITLEVPHLLQLMQNNQFDTIYHEHFSYFSVITLEKIFSTHGFIIFNVEEISTHGGSLRIYVKDVKNNEFLVNSSVERIIKKEIECGLTDISTYTNFGEKIKNIRKAIKEFFDLAKNENKNIVGYGAAAKGNTLLNYCEIGKEFMDYVVDRNIHKQGLYLPGTHIPVKNPKEILNTKPDYLVILPWNLKDEIMNQWNFIKQWGGKFVTLIPDVEIYS